MSVMRVGLVPAGGWREAASREMWLGRAIVIAGIVAACLTIYLNSRLGRDDLLVASYRAAGLEVAGVTGSIMPASDYGGFLQTAAMQFFFGTLAVLMLAGGVVQGAMFALGHIDVEFRRTLGVVTTAGWVFCVQAGLVAVAAGIAFPQPPEGVELALLHAVGVGSQWVGPPWTRVLPAVWFTSFVVVIVGRLVRAEGGRRWLWMSVAATVCMALAILAATLMA